MNFGTLRAIVDLLRPHQWVKNFFVLAPLIFSKKLLVVDAVSEATAAFFIFCGLASVVYIFNDLQDLESDKNHPQKRFRALASGKISSRIAWVVLFLLLIPSLFFSFWLHMMFGIVALSYLLLNFFYSLWLKHVVLIDVMAVAANYVLRVVGGTVAIQAPITSWLVIVSTLLALFLALGKRRHELVLLGDNATDHRAILREYSPYFLDQLIGIVTTSTVIVYSFYTMDPKIGAFLGTEFLPLSIPFVLFGIFRYLYLIHQKQKGGNPTTILLTDRPLLVTIIVWVMTLFFTIYI